jgi:hypothetical protein
VFKEYYKRYWSMLQVPHPNVEQIFVDVNWRERKDAIKTEAGKSWLPFIQNVSSTLDYGGGNRLTGVALKNLGYKGTYEVCDFAEDAKPEYFSLEDVKKEYDLVTCFQVIEHIYFEDFIKFIPKLLEKVKPGGWLAIASDNPGNAGHLWNVELGHVKAFPFVNLYQYLVTLGMKSEGAKVFLQYVSEDSFKNKLLYRFRKLACKLLGIDPFHSYILFIQKNQPE